MTAPELWLRPDGSSFLVYGPELKQESYSVQEAGRAWGYHPTMVHGWIQEGRLPEAVPNDGPGGGWSIPGRLVEAGRPAPSGPVRPGGDAS